MPITATLEGFEALDKRLATVAEATKTDLRQAMQASLLLIEADYKAGLRPYRLTGRSERSVTSKIETVGATVVGQVGPSSAWGRAFELGRPRGIWPPLGPLLVWVRARHLSGVYSLKSQRRLGGKATRAAQDLAAARGVQRAIWARGIKPHPALIPAFDKNKGRIEALFARVGVTLISRISTGSR